MKKLIRISFLVLLAFVIGIGTVDAQNYGKKKKKKKKKKPAKTEQTDDYFDESGGFAHRLWYGGMVNFQIGGSNGNSALLLGLSPMVGYKITDFLSAGPRVTLNYYREYLRGDDFKVMELGVGAFTRAKFTPTIFAHIEYETIKLNEISDFGLQEGRENNFYGGVGYNSAGGEGFGYEIMVLYNFLEEDRDTQVPIEFRVGFTYNF